MLWNKKDINPPIRELSVAGKTSIKNCIKLLYMYVCIAVVLSAMNGTQGEHITKQARVLTSGHSAGYLT